VSLRLLRCVLLTAGGALCCAQSPADPQRSTAIADLPRPGYEPRTLTLGGIVVTPRVDLGATYNDNIFATRAGEIGDVVFNLQPALEGRRQTTSSDLRLAANANLIRYARYDRENVTTFRGLADWRGDVAPRQSIRARASFDRSYQRRSDPEADFGAGRRPTLIDVAEAGLDYRFTGARLGMLASATATNYNFLPETDADRDLAVYRVALRGSYAVSGRTSVYLQGYAVRRDARLRVDRYGVDRDASTAGALAGVSFDVSSRVQGELGIGAFRSDPSDPTLRAFSGLAASGQLTWQPRVRTAITLDAFRGDVATIRAGAIGRVDTRLSLAIDQELRHDVLARAAVGIRDVAYRGAIDRDQRFRFAELEGTYLLNRHLAVLGNGSFTRRDADQPIERFSRWTATLGLRLTY